MALDTRARRISDSGYLRELITNFDAVFDIGQFYEYCVPHLTHVKQPNDLNNCPLLDLAEYLGAVWCRIVQADVEYRIVDGLHLVEQSAGAASALRKLMEGADGESVDSFVAYVAARWHDGVAKTQYRCRNHTDARFNFEFAQRQALSASLWYCRNDIVSNYLRNVYEERLAPGVADESGAKARKTRYDLFQEAIDFAEQVANTRQIDIPGPGQADVVLDEAPKENREFLRGLSSLLHNMSIEARTRLDTARKKADHEAADEWFESSRLLSERSEVICRALQDDYRLGQAVFHQGTLLAARDPERACERFVTVRDDVNWSRGKILARQQLAVLDESRAGDDIDRVLAAIDQLFELIDHIQSLQEAAGDEQGFDAAVHSYTVQLLDGIVSRRLLDQDGDIAVSARHHEDAKRTLARLRKEKLEMVRTMRQVVKIGPYKADFARSIYPIFLNLIAELLLVSQPDLDQGLSLVEESSGRELLDMVARNVRRRETSHWDKQLELATVPVPSPFSEPADMHAANVGEAQFHRLGPAIRIARRGEDDTFDEDDQRVQDSLNRYEERMQNAPVASTKHVEDISQRVRDYTKSNDVAILRYAFYADRRVGRRLGVFVSRQGQLTYRDNLEFEAVLGQVRECLQMQQESESGQDYPLAFKQLGIALWQNLIQPVWSEWEQSPGALLIVPVTELFAVPFHAAVDPSDGILLGARLPVAYSVTATAHITGGRDRLARLSFGADDRLGALMIPDKRGRLKEGKEVFDAGWPSDRFDVAGPEEVRQVVEPVAAGTPAGLFQLAARDPAALVISGHGRCVEREGYNEPFLDFPATNEILTHYDLAGSLKLEANKLTILAACLTGQGVDVGGGEVAGFVRSLMAAGCGALGVTLWSVDSRHISALVKYLLQLARVSAEQHVWFDVVRAVHYYYAERMKDLDSVSLRMEACPLAIYL